MVGLLKRIFISFMLMLSEFGTLYCQQLPTDSFQQTEVLLEDEAWDVALMGAWVQEEQQHNSQFKVLDASHIEVFQFALRAGSDMMFKWDPPNRESAKNLLLELEVYAVTEIGEVSMPFSLNENQNVEVFSKYTEASNYYHLSRVYEHKYILFDFANHDSQFLRFLNNYPSTMIVVAHLEFPGHMISPTKTIDDDDLQAQGQQMRELLKELEILEHQRQRIFLVEESRLRLENQHFNQLLLITSLELLGVVGTGILQAYCIRRVLDNKKIV